MRPNFINLLFIFAILLIITACVCRSDRNSESSAPQSNVIANQAINTQAQAKETPSAPQNNPGKKKDEGDFIVEHLEVQNSRYEEIDRQVKDEKLLEKAADKLNRALILPTDLFIKTKDCGEVNAFYNPNDTSVTICYELMEHFFKVYKSAGESDEKAYDKMFAAVQFVFLHEIGHALIDQYKLPITANEEDAADRCSSYINLEELGDEGVRAVLAAADGFAIESKQRLPKDQNMADEHLLQEQRFYNALCMTYGSNPDKYNTIVTEGYLPKERAVRCPAEYQRTVESWKNLLEPWRKN
jgi:hypothetical protein